MKDKPYVVALYTRMSKEDDEWVSLETKKKAQHYQSAYAPV